MFYISGDADNLGSMVSSVAVTGNLDRLLVLTKKIKRGNELCRDWIAEAGGELVEQGGDEFIATLPNLHVHWVRKLRSEYLETVGASLSVGIGNDLSSAMLARQFAKVTGKNRAVIFHSDWSGIYRVDLISQNTGEDDGN